MTSELSAASGREIPDHDCALYSRLTNELVFMGAERGTRSRWTFKCQLCPSPRAEITERDYELDDSPVVAAAKEVLAHANVARNTHPAGSALPATRLRVHSALRVDGSEQSSGERGLRTMGLVSDNGRDAALSGASVRSRQRISQISPTRSRRRDSGNAGLARVARIVRALWAVK